MKKEFGLELDSSRRFWWLYSQYRQHWAEGHYRRSFFLSLLTFFASLVAVFFASNYATSRASNYVSDIILSNVPVFDVNGLFVYGTFALIVFTTYLCFERPRQVPFVLFSLGIFYFVRAVFISLTHLGPFPVQAQSDFGSIITRLFFGSDYFFSGHTGTPFLLALFYWREHIVRYLYLAWSLFFSTIVLLGHLHYTIDVLSALFITYAIADICRFAFRKEYQLFMSDGG